VVIHRDDGFVEVYDPYAASREGILDEAPILRGEEAVILRNEGWAAGPEPCGFHAPAWAPPETVATPHLVANGMMVYSEGGRPQVVIACLAAGTMGDFRPRVDGYQARQVHHVKVRPGRLWNHL
jgi:hypothetical protein